MGASMSSFPVDMNAGERFPQDEQSMMLLAKGEVAMVEVDLILREWEAEVNGPLPQAE